VKDLPDTWLVYKAHTIRAWCAALLRSCLCACCALAHHDTQANVVISATRVIVDLPPGNTAIRLRNTSPSAALVQLWTDSGEEQSTPDTSNAPFELTPSLFVLEGGQTQTVRVHYDGEPPPDLNERLYWFNMLDVPSREPPPIAASDAGSLNDAGPVNELNFVLRTRIKLFLRTADTSGQALSAPEKLVWTIHEGNGSAPDALTASNPTAFHVSCAQLVLLAPHDRVRSLGTRTFAPGETVRFALGPDPASAASSASNAVAALKSKTASSDWNEAVCHAINDYGSLDTFRAQVNRKAAGEAADAGAEAQGARTAHAASGTRAHIDAGKGTDTTNSTGTGTGTGTGTD
jgi:chaperone protein EcpD